MWRFLRPGASIRCTWGLFKAGYSCRAFFWLDMIALKLGSWLWMSRGNWPVSTSRIIWNHDSPVEHCGLMPKKLVILGIPLQHTGSLWSYHWSYCLSYTSQRSQHFQPVSFGGFSKHIKDVSAARNLVRSAAFQQRYLGSRKIHTPHEGWIPGGVLQLFQVLCHFCNTNFFGWTKLAKIPVLHFRSRMGNEGCCRRHIHIDARRSVWWCDRPRHRSCGFFIIIEVRTTCGPSGPLSIFVVQTVKHRNVSTLQATRLNRFIRMVAQLQWSAMTSWCPYCPG